MRFRTLPLAILVLAAVPVRAQQDGAYLFSTYCAICHEAANGEQVRGPDRSVLRQMTPEHILEVLEKGIMKAQAAERSRAQRRILAEYLSEKRFGSAPPELIPKSAFCGTSVAAAFSDSPTGPAWNGWGVTITNTRFQPAAAAQLGVADVPRLTLKWAFGYPGATSGGTQPVVISGRLYVGTAEGDVYSLDAKSGCVHWTYQADAGVRGAISIGKAGKNDDGTLAAYFGDQSANVYALEAHTGKLLWRKKVDDYWRAGITGAPVLPCSVERLGPGRFALRPGTPIYVGRDTPREEAIAAAAQVVADTLEERIRNRPELWYHFYRYWNAQRDEYDGLA